MSFHFPFQLSVLGDPRVRGYVHSSFNGAASVALDYCTHALASLHHEGKVNLSAEPSSWYIGLVWHDSEEPAEVLDVFQYHDYQSWPGNPDVHNFIVRNGIYVPEAAISCTEGILLLGQEEQLRRKTTSLEEYFNTALALETVNSFFGYSSLPKLI